MQKRAIVTGVTLLLTAAISFRLGVHTDAAEDAKSTPASTPVVQKAFVSFRIGPGQWMPEDRFGELLAMFEKHKGVTDELTFFTSVTICPLPLEEVKRRCQILAQRMAQARALGYRAGVDVTATLGHCEEDLPHALSGEYTCLVDVTGRVGKGLFCPNDPRVQAYVAELYRLVTETKPDFVWIDDDVRMASHPPVARPCFCDNCLAIFAKECGTKYTREELRKALTEGPMEKRIALRKAWLAHNETSIVRLLAVIERAVHGVRPDLPIGEMYALRFYDGNGAASYAAALAGPKSTPVYWRPGAGFYNDFTPGDAFRKSHMLGRQVSLLPPWLVTIESEVENFPYQRVMKSCQITAVEAAAHIAAGCTGTAFAVLPVDAEPIGDYEPMFERLRQVRPFLDRMAKTFGRLPPVGVWSAWKKDAALTADSGGGDWFAQAEWPLGRDDSQVFELGVPAAYGPENAKVTLLNRQSASMFSNDELKRILSSGVYTDAETLTLLNARGFQDLTGMAVAKSFSKDCIEVNVAHPLNGPLAGRRRDARQSYGNEPAHHLKLVDPKAQTLARLVDYADQEKAPTSMAVFENRLGGRICVAGYCPWTHLASQNRVTQMTSVLRWLSGDQLPAYVGSYHKAVLWARKPNSKQLSVALFNASFDPADKLTLMLLTQASSVKVVDMAGQEQSVAASGDDGPYRRFVLPQVEPWSARLVLTSE